MSDTPARAAAPAPAAFSCCHHCGSAYPPGMDFPKTCAACQQTHYQNPKPVAVALIPCEDGLLGVVRGIPPAYGETAFPGGFMEVNESAEEAAARETFEETGLRVDPSKLKYAGSAFNARGNLMLFYRAEMEPIALPALAPNPETLRLEVITPGLKLAFPLHQEAAGRWFDEFGESQPSRTRAPGR